MNRLTLLSDNDIAAIHKTSLRILSEIGVQIPVPPVLDRLEQAGAKVDRASETARLPENLVMDSLQKAGKKYILYGRDNSQSVRFGYGDFILPSTEGQVMIVEDDGRVRRPATGTDVRNAIRISDALEHIDWLGGIVLPDDVPPAIRDVWLTAELLKGSTKPQHVFFDNAASFRYAVKVCEAAAGSREENRRHPRLAAFIEPISPLRFARNGLEVLVACVQEELPVYFGPMVQTGSTGPVTMAGTAALENAEVLSAVVIAQVFNPGIPVGYGCSCHTVDLKSMMISFGAAEQSLFGVAMTQMAHYYGLPSLFNAGLADSKRHDAQSGIERGITMICGALAGLETFGPMGIVGADQGASLEQLIIDNEMGGYVKRILKGFEVNEENLAWEVIQRVGIGGNFMTDDHTLAHFRDELWSSPGFDRRNWDTWSAAGAKSMYDWALDRKQQILDEHEPEPIDPKLSTELDEIVAAAQRELAG